MHQHSFNFQKVKNLYAKMAYVGPGIKGTGKVLIHRGFRYQKNKMRTNSINWRCWRKDCQSTLRSNLFDITDIEPNIVVFEEEEVARENNPYSPTPQ